MSHAGTTRGLATEGERYQRLDRIATGGMGEVWRARDTVLGREVAVKVLKREYAEDPTFRQRFAAEARHAASLHHPGIASVFDYGVLEDGTPFLVMELVDGRPLSELLAGGKVLDPEQARALVGQAAEALGVAHRAGVVHRDVKPANLLVTPDGQVKITDFGIARAADSANITHTGQIVGTPHYLSPEQAEGRAATAASDVYALGVLLFECLAGVRPFVAETPVAIALAHLRQDVPPLPPDIPPDLAEVTRRALAKDPAERYADGAELAAALRAASADAPVPADATRVMDTGDLPSPTERSRPLGAAAAAVAAAPAAAVGAAAPALRDRRRWPLYLAGALAALLVVVLLVAHPWSDDSTGGNGSTPSTAAATDVTVRRAAYVGEPVAQARRQLRRLGLETTTSPAANDGSHTPGTVADLFPTGKVQRGETVRLQVWGAAPTSAPPSTSAPAPTSAPQHQGPPEKKKGKPKGGGGHKGKKG